ncbi:hypothetical protein HK098_000228 [Nowakowskiella sp. JEL0407]|nr:hypothetical protein HK098_000228 [Nowakowskiella sp. JEL0407]
MTSSFTHSIAFSSIEFDLKSPVAYGKFTIVHKGRWEGRTVAVKVFRQKFSQQFHEEILKETENLVVLRDANINTIYGVSTNSKITLLVVEFADNGSLSTVFLKIPEFHPDYIKQCPESINSPEVVNHLMLQISRGMAFLHSQNPPIIHGHLNASNCLLHGIHANSKSLLTSTVKITNFGLYGIKIDSDLNDNDTRWIAPELKRTRTYSTATDVYAYSLTSYEILMRGQIDGFVNHSLARPPPTHPPIFLESHWEIITQCASPYPDLRLRFEDVCDMLELIFRNEENRYLSVIEDGSRTGGIGNNESGTNRENEYIEVNRKETFEFGTNRENKYIEIIRNETRESRSNSDNQYIELNRKENRDSISSYSREKLETEDVDFPPQESLSRDKSKKPAIWKNRNFLIFMVFMFIVLVSVAIVVPLVQSANRNPLIERIYSLDESCDGLWVFPDTTGPRLLVRVGSDIQEYNSTTGAKLKSVSIENQASAGSPKTLPGNLPHIFLKNNYQGIREWDLNTGQIVRNYTYHRNYFAAQTVLLGNSPRLFASIDVSLEDNDYLILEWDIITGQIVRGYRGHRYRIVALTVLPGDPPPLFSGSWDKTVLEWDTTTGRMVRNYTGHTDWVTSVAVLAGSPPRLFSGSSSSTIREWNTTTGLGKSASYKAFGDPIVLPSDPPRLFAREWGTISEYTLDTWEKVRNYTGHEGYIGYVTLYGKNMFSCDSNRKLIQWKI